MAFSSSEGKLFCRDWLIRMFMHDQVRTILDIGPGSGTYGMLVKQSYNEAQAIYRKYNHAEMPNSIQMINAVEIFYPYVKRFGLEGIYDNIYCISVTEVQLIENTYDLIIFGDVLEHLEKEEAVKVWNNFKQISKFLYLSIPCKLDGKSWSRGYDQLPAEGDENKYELHLHNWKYDEILNELGPFLWQVPLPTVVTMIAEGNLK